MHAMFRNKVFSDFKDMAVALLEISRTGNTYFYPPACQLGMDMLKRLGEVFLLVDELLDRRMILEALRFISTHGCPNLDIKKLILVAEDT
jgi:hypothetical protein